MINILYLIQVAVIFSILYFLYKIFLEKLTFHNTNRMVLLLLIPLSLLVPKLGNLMPSFATSFREVSFPEEVSFESFNQHIEVVELPLVAVTSNYALILALFYFLVVAIFLIRIIGALRNLYLLKRQAEIQHKDGYNLLIAPVPEIFSYFCWIFIPQKMNTTHDAQILNHERSHVQLRHSWDVLIVEVYIAFFWFNPFLYLYRKSLKSVHEYQADNSVLQNGLATEKYMQLLLKSIEASKPNHFYNYFNQSLLKKRIDMMTKPKSNGLAKLKYILLLPVCMVLISAFTSPVHNSNTYSKLINVSTMAQVGPPSLFPVQNASKTDISALYGVIGKHRLNKGKVHHGIDIKANTGTPVVATADGIVAKATSEGNWGNLIVIEHSDGFETWYAHLHGFNSSKDQRVEKGDVIGYVGSTGRSTGPHLHYEVKQNGKRLDPLNYFE